MVGPPPPTWEIAAADAGAREVIAGIWRLRLPLAWGEISHVNAFAIAHDDGIMLVDCGSAGHHSAEDALVHALAEAGHELADVRMLVATHTHSDHVGLAEFVIAHSGCEFLMHPASHHFYDAMRNPAAIEAARRRRARDEGVPERLLHHYGDVREETEGVLAPVEPDRPLVEGVRLPSAVGEWEVVEAPGHAPSHVFLLQPEHRIAIVGDLLSLAFAPYFDYGYSPDPVGEYLGSLERLERCLPLELALPGHGRPLVDVEQLIEDHRRGVEERLAATSDAVAQGPAGAYEITRRVFGEPASDVLGVWQMAEVLVYLRHLRVSGLLARERREDGSFVYLVKPRSRDRRCPT